MIRPAASVSRVVDQRLRSGGCPVQAALRVGPEDQVREQRTGRRVGRGSTDVRLEGRDRRVQVVREVRHPEVVEATLQAAQVREIDRHRAVIRERCESQFEQLRSRVSKRSGRGEGRCLGSGPQQGRVHQRGGRDGDCEVVERLRIRGCRLDLVHRPFGQSPERGCIERVDLGSLFGIQVLVEVGLLGLGRREDQGIEELPRRRSSRGWDLDLIEGDVDEPRTRGRIADGDFLGSREERPGSRIGTRLDQRQRLQPGRQRSDRGRCVGHRGDVRGGFGRSSGRAEG